LGPGAVKPLIKAFGDWDSDVRRAATEALGKLGDKRAVEPLIKALDDKEWDVRRAAAEALGKLGDPRAVEPLIKALNGGSSAAAEALGQLGDKRAVDPLIKTLGDERYDVRRNTAEALGNLGEPKWKEIVKGDAQDWARLGACGDPRAVEPLIKALGDGGGRNVRRAAAEALAKIASATPSVIGKRWKQIRERVMQPHHDCPIACGGHDDSGIGLDFPALPPGLDF
jgi:HEAT repeat protein